MRRFKNLKKLEQKKLLSTFSDIEKVVAVENPSTYKYMAVSVFDGWLGKKNYHLLVDVSVEEQKKRDYKFELFANKLIENTQVVNFTMKGKWSNKKAVFRQFNSIEVAQEYMKPATSDGMFFEVVLPEFEVIYIESWDDTNIFYLKDEKYADLLEKWANDCGLYCFGK